MKIQLNYSQQKFLFLLGMTIIYIAFLARHDFLRGPLLWDEHHFWKTTLTFSDRLLPRIDDLRDYNELNTPLPFIIFGMLEYLFHQGIFAGRLLNMILSLIILFVIGWPRHGKHERSILCAVGLLLCPYYLWYSGLLYTDTIACFWVLMGVISYVHNRHLISGIAFILAIASRQYALAFPAAIVTYEFMIAIAKAKNLRRVNLVEQWRWLAPLVAGLSIFGWIYLFQGLAPEMAMNNRNVAEVQKTFWALTPGGVINFLAFVGFYIVIPEFILFQPRNQITALKQQWRKIACVTAGFSLYFYIFPPLLYGLGTVIKIVNLLPYDILKLALFYVLSLLTCVRFSQLNLISLMVLFNSLIMMKAYPWDKYILPLVVIFWYLKSVDFADRLGNSTLALDINGKSPESESNALAGASFSDSWGRGKNS